MKTFYLFDFHLCSPIIITPRPFCFSDWATMTIRRQTTKQSAELQEIDKLEDSPELNLLRKHCRTGKPWAAHLRSNLASVWWLSGCSYHTRRRFCLHSSQAASLARRLSHFQSRRALIPKTANEKRLEIGFGWWKQTRRIAQQKWCFFRKAIVVKRRQKSGIPRFSSEKSINLLAFWFVIAHRCSLT